MTSEYDRPLLQSMDDTSSPSIGLSLADIHFDAIGAVDKNNTVDSVRNATKDLLERESGVTKETSGSKGESKFSENSVNLEERNEDDSPNKQKRTETPDSEIVVIDNNDDNQSIGSGLDSDAEGNDSDAAAGADPPIPKEYDPSIDDRLPDTVTLLTTPDGGKLYLIGTAHFSVESQNDVSNIIQAVQPHIVMVELCKARVHILQLDEKTILQEAENLTFQIVRDTIQQNGPLNGLLYILLLNMSAHLTRELGMAPGGEFRRAFSEAKKVPNCLVHLGDRPINITLQRALSSLGWWQTFKLGWHLFSAKDPISKEEVERCKRRDMLEEILAEMAGEYPALGEVFVKERDLYLAHSLQLACLPQRTSNGWKSSRVVGVVGIGHVRGIVEHWGKVQSSEIVPIMRIPPPSLSSKILRITIKASLVGAVIFVGYKIIPLPSVLTLQSIKSSVEGLLKFAIKMMEGKYCTDEYEHTTVDIMYVANNIPGPGIDVEDFESEFIIGCDCLEANCNDNCSCVRDLTNYHEQRLNVEKLSGLLIECNPRCSCNDNCNNRLIQRGPLDCLEIMVTVDKGLGLRTTRWISKYRFICEYAGEVIGIEEARRRGENNKRHCLMNYILVVTEHIGERKIITCIDPKYFGNIGRYCNHSCQPNAILVPVRVESNVPRLCLFALRDININEEITFDYSGGMDKSLDNTSETPCYCGADCCLGYLPNYPI